jgi:anti-sigma B factor antagonist
MKSFGDERIAGGESLLVVDLAGCTGMDSTFMGTLAGMAARLSAMDGGVLQIAEPGERNRRSLEDLGLDFLMEINPPTAKWRGKVDEIRSKLGPPRAPTALGQIERARQVLDAHQTLSEVSDKNAREFAGVVEMLKDQVSDKEASDAAKDGE